MAYGHCRDILWNSWELTDPEAAQDDMADYGFNYPAEEGETHAHTYHWVNTLKALGQVNGQLRAEVIGDVSGIRRRTKSHRGRIIRAQLSIDLSQRLQRIHPVIGVGVGLTLFRWIIEAIIRHIGLRRLWVGQRRDVQPNNSQ